jgi:hypothetical protein
VPVSALKFLLAVVSIAIVARSLSADEYAANEHIDPTVTITLYSGGVESEGSVLTPR